MMIFMDVPTNIFYFLYKEFAEENVKKGVNV